MRRDTENLDVDTRRKNHKHRARYGEPGHPELALHGKHEPYGGRGHIDCSDLLQVLTLLCFMPKREELARWVEDHWPISTRILPSRLGVEAAVRAARAGAPHPLLVEAICQMGGIQLLVPLMNTHHRSWHFGISGPIHHVYRTPEGRYILALRPPPERYVETEECAREMESFAFEPPPDVLGGEEDEAHPSEDDMDAEPAPPEPEDFPDPDPVPDPEPQLPPTNDPQPQPQQDPEELGAPQPRYWLRPRPLRGPRPTRRQPRQPEVRDQPPFRPHNIENLRPEHRIELATPDEEAYHVCEENKIWCRLPDCTRPATPFKTVAAWKVHVRRAACHQKATLCTWCGHVIVMPSPDLSAEHIGMIMDAHRAERCVGAPRKTMGARRAAAARLEILGRDNSHIAFPEEGADEETVPNPRKRHLTSEAARRADECLRYIKRFKADNPELMRQLGAEYQLQIV